MNFEFFKETLRQRYKIDLNAYKETQMKRRLDSLMAKKKMRTGSYEEVLDWLAKDKNALVEFMDTLTINVSEFFRDKHAFDVLENQVLPSILAAKNSLRIWSAACSVGAEPYSIAIILDEKTPGRRHVIEATDIDQSVLAAAALGRYGPEQVRNVAPGRLAKYFKKQGSHYYLDERIKKSVHFRRHDLLVDPFGSDYDLIVCRNVTIYFTREAQGKLNEKFYRALAPGGYLFIGASEMIFNYRELGYEKKHSCFYQKGAGVKGVSSDSVKRNRQHLF
ncbi:MAG: protein-glutamate O-methyltransferase CheR [Firmicutes bacterium]|nr:protein-glutamate O-methyltransferase CheR [Bacillota bacterium]